METKEESKYTLSSNSSRARLYSLIYAVNKKQHISNLVYYIFLLIQTIQLLSIYLSKEYILEWDLDSTNDNMTIYEFHHNNSTIKSIGDKISYLRISSIFSNLSLTSYYILYGVIISIPVIFISIIIYLFLSYGTDDSMKKGKKSIHGESGILEKNCKALVNSILFFMMVYFIPFLEMALSCFDCTSSSTVQYYNNQMTINQTKINNESTSEANRILQVSLNSAIEPNITIKDYFDLLILNDNNILECDSTVILFQVISIFVIILVLFFIFFFNYLYKNEFNTKQNIIRASSKISNIFICLQIFVLIFEIINKDTWFKLVVYCFLYGSLFIYASFVKSYNSFGHNFLHLLQIGLLFYFVSILLITKLFQDVYFSGSSFLIICSLFIFILMTYLLTIVNYSKMFALINIDKLTNQEDYFNQTSQLKEIIDQFIYINDPLRINTMFQDSNYSMEKNKAYFLIYGFINTHEENCIDSDCSLKEIAALFNKKPNRIIETFQTKKNNLIIYLNFYLLKGIQLFPQSKKLIILYILFNLEKKLNLHSVKIYIKKLEEDKNTLYEDYTLYYLNQLLSISLKKGLNPNYNNNEENISFLNDTDNSEEGSLSLNVNPSFNENKNYEKFKELLDNTVKMFSEFWAIFSSNNSESVNLKKIFSLSKQITSNINQIILLWETDIRFHKISVELRYIIDLFYEFARIIIKDSALADDINKVIQRDFLKVADDSAQYFDMKNIDIVLETQDMFAYARANEKGECLIIKASLSLVSSLGYSRSEIISKPVETIMPSIFRIQHAHMLSKRVARNRSSMSKNNADIERKQVLVYPVCKNKYIFPLKTSFIVKADEEMSNSFIIKVKFEKVPLKGSYFYHLLINGNMEIENLSSSCIHIGLSNELLQQTTLNISNIILDENMKEIDFKNDWKNYYGKSKAIILVISPSILNEFNKPKTKGNVSFATTTNKKNTITSLIKPQKRRLLLTIQKNIWSNMKNLVSYYFILNDAPEIIPKPIYLRPLATNKRSFYYDINDFTFKSYEISIIKSAMNNTDAHDRNTNIIKKFIKKNTLNKSMNKSINSKNTNSPRKSNIDSPISNRKIKLKGYLSGNESSGKEEDKVENKKDKKSIVNSNSPSTKNNAKPPSIFNFNFKSLLMEKAEEIEEKEPTKKLSSKNKQSNAKLINSNSTTNNIPIKTHDDFSSNKEVSKDASLHKEEDGSINYSLIKQFVSDNFKAEKNSVLGSINKKEIDRLDKLSNNMINDNLSEIKQSSRNDLNNMMMTENFFVNKKVSSFKEASKQSINNHATTQTIKEIDIFNQEKEGIDHNNSKDIKINDNNEKSTVTKSNVEDEFDNFFNSNNQTDNDKKSNSNSKNDNEDGSSNSNSDDEVNLDLYQQNKSKTKNDGNTSLEDSLIKSQYMKLTKEGDKQLLSKEELDKLVSKSLDKIKNFINKMSNFSDGIVDYRKNHKMELTENVIKEEPIIYKSIMNFSSTVDKVNILSKQDTETNTVNLLNYISHQNINQGLKQIFPLTISFYLSIFFFMIFILTITSAILQFKYSLEYYNNINTISSGLFYNNEIIVSSLKILFYSSYIRFYNDLRKQNLNLLSSNGYTSFSQITGESIFTNNVTNIYLDYFFEDIYSNYTGTNNKLTNENLFLMKDIDNYLNTMIERKYTDLYENYNILKNNSDLLSSIINDDTFTNNFNIDESNKNAATIDYKLVIKNVPYISYLNDYLNENITHEEKMVIFQALLDSPEYISLMDYINVIISTAINFYQNTNLLNAKDVDEKLIFMKYNALNYPLITMRKNTNVMYEVLLLKISLKDYLIVFLCLNLIIFLLLLVLGNHLIAMLIRSQERIVDVFFTLNKSLISNFKLECERFLQSFYNMNNTEAGGAEFSNEIKVIKEKDIQVDKCKIYFIFII